MKYSNPEDNEVVLQYNPLMSSRATHQSENTKCVKEYISSNLFEVEQQLASDSDSDINVSSQNSTDSSDSDVNYHNDWYDDEDLYTPQRQLSTAVSKVQIKLNNLINNHKASLKLHDDIVDLVNEYISSPNFDKYATLKSRKTFIRSMESSYGVTHLRPINTEAQLHDHSKVTVAVFDAKAMILDLLTNQNLMKKTNIVEGYDLASGDVNPNNQCNQKYSEIHTGDEWLPARDSFCNPPDDTHNDMPIALVIFGDKSHMDLHGALALTPIIFTLSLFNRTSRNNASYWRPLAYIPNLATERTRQTKLLIRIRSKMSTSVFLLRLNLFDESIEREGSGNQCWAGKLTSRSGFIFSLET